MARPPRRRTERNLALNVVIAVVAVLAAVVVALSVSYLYRPAEEMRFVEQRAAFAEALWAIRLHAAGGMLALIVGPVQLLPVVRSRFLLAHRWIGRGYLLAVAVGVVGAFGLAPTAFGGLTSTAGFMLLAIFWAACAAMACARIRARDVTGHMAWMRRAYALTFAAVTLRLELLILVAAGFGFEAAYRTVAWLCWVPNLAIMELWLASRRGRLVGGTS